ncbi:hypothetical protein Bhyg_04423 [Pseudolycoriella hygida]|uniref:Glucuronosyltransferase n=1 Tax=Pseudolycoriella hygida TaxID=35572 RepID=A0A9Q0NGQ1_9DIPT|nr:hypothetical protein Bhyg_04423 [Pseudolycoriella hygida]
MDNLENLTSFRTVFTLLSFCLGVSSSNILVVTPLASTSHFKVGEAITVGLANAGHNVTILSAYDYKPKNASNIESIQIIGAIEKSEGKNDQNAVFNIVQVINPFQLNYRGGSLATVAAAS